MALTGLVDVEVVAKKDAARRAMVSAVAPDHLQLLDLVDYMTLDVQGKFPELKEKDEVGYVRIGKGTYILPGSN